jgi:hypothetical protein
MVKTRTRKMTLILKVWSLLLFVTILQHKTVSKGFSFSKEFDIYLTELASPAKSAEKPAAVASRLIAFKNLQELASKNGFTVRNLALYKLRPR